MMKSLLWRLIILLQIRITYLVQVCDLRSRHRGMHLRVVGAPGHSSGNDSSSTRLLLLLHRAASPFPCLSLLYLWCFMPFFRGMFSEELPACCWAWMYSTVAAGAGSAQHGAARPLLTDPPETPAAPGHWHAAQQGQPITHIIPHTVCCTSRWPVLRGTAGEAFRLLPNTQLAGAGLPSRRHVLLAHRGPQEPGNALPYPTSLPSSHTQRCHSGCTRGKNTTWLKLEVREMSRVQAQLHFSCTSAALTLRDMGQLREHKKH